MLAVCIGVVLYLFYLISIFKAEIPELAPEGYMSLLMVYDSESENEDEKDSQEI